MSCNRDIESLFAPRPYGEMSPSVKPETLVLCVVIGLAVAWIASNTAMTRPMNTHPMYAPIPAMVNSARRAMQTVLSSESTHPMFAPIPTAVNSARRAVSEAFSGCSNLHHVDAPGLAKTPDAWKKMTDKEKEQVLASLMKLLVKKPGSMLMIFAPWCPHCHNAMPAFKEKAKSNPDTTFVLCNAEALPQHAFGAGPKALFNIQYFPTFCKCEVHNGKVELTEMTLDDENTSASKDDGDAMTDNAEEGMDLATLF